MFANASLLSFGGEKSTREEAENVDDLRSMAVQFCYSLLYWAAHGCTMLVVASEDLSSPTQT